MRLRVLLLLIILAAISTAQDTNFPSHRTPSSAAAINMLLCPSPPPPRPRMARCSQAPMPSPRHEFAPPWHAWLGDAYFAASTLRACPPIRPPATRTQSRQYRCSAAHFPRNGSGLPGRSRTAGDQCHRTDRGPNAGRHKPFGTGLNSKNHDEKQKPFGTMLNRLASMRTRWRRKPAQEAKGGMSYVSAAQGFTLNCGTWMLCRSFLSRGFQPNPWGGYLHPLCLPQN